MLLDTPFKTKTSLFEASAEWYDFGNDTLTFLPKTCCILGSLCRMAKSLGVSPAILRLLDFENSEVQMVLPQFAHDPYLRVELWVNTCRYKWSLVFVAGGGMVS